MSVLVQADVIEVDPGLGVFGGGGLGNVDPEVGTGDLAPVVHQLGGTRKLEQDQRGDF